MRMLPDGDPRSDRFRSGGRDRKFLAAMRAFAKQHGGTVITGTRNSKGEVINQSVKKYPNP
jgi:hypothetical protein